MARANFLETKTLHLLDLIGNGKTFQVLPFQRDYSWGEEQWEDLWTDITALRQNPETRHYMGALVLEAKSDRDFLIIDGQQRLATLSIFALAVIARLNDLSREGNQPLDNEVRAQSLRNTYIGQKDPVSLTESSKLSLNKSDCAFYQDNLVALRPPANPRALIKSNRALWDCFRWFSRKLQNDLAISQQGAELAKLLNETVARRLLFIQITVDDEMNAYTVFETLNARGLELSSTDLLKNYLFSRVPSPADLDALERRWGSLINTVRQESFPEFLRYHLLCEHRSIRQQRLFVLIRSQIKSPTDVFELIQALETRAELFSALFDETHGFWLDNPDNKPYIRLLKLFAVRQMTPLLFATWERFSKPDFTRVLKLLTVISFRYTIIGSRNTNELEPAYHDAAKAVLNQTATTPAQVFDLLRPIYLSDEKFIQDFSSIAKPTQGNSKRLVKYILCRLEAEGRQTEVDFDTDPATIEHILPENPSSNWDSDFPQKLADASLYRLGNLTLLESNLNRDIGNLTFPEKLSAYIKSAYHLTKSIPTQNPEEWTPARLENRQAQMARRAAHIWRSDFD